MIKEINASEIKENLGAKTYVMFHADWCGPCQMTKPSLKEIGDSDEYTVLLVDVDENKESAREMGVQGIPTIVMYKDSKEFNRHTGFANKDMLLKAFEG